MAKEQKEQYQINRFEQLSVPSPFPEIIGKKLYTNIPNDWLQDLRQAKSLSIVNYTKPPENVDESSLKIAIEAFNKVINKIEESEKSEAKYYNPQIKRQAYQHIAENAEYLAKGDEKSEFFQMAVNKYKSAYLYGFKAEFFNDDTTIKPLVLMYKNNNIIDKLKSEYLQILDNHNINDNLSYEEQILAHRILSVIGVETVDHVLGIKHSSKSYELTQGKIDLDAYRVEQREVGIMSKGKIGTDNLQQCVAVVLYDHQTKKTALSHVDFSTTAESLTEVINSNFKNSKKVQAYLIGANDTETENSAHSEANRKKVKKVLESSPNIEIHELGLEKGIKAFVFDIDKCAIELSVPGKLSASTAARKCLVQALDSPKELHQAFNFIEKPDVIISPRYSDEQLKNFLKSAFDLKVSDDGTMRTSSANTSWPLLEFAQQIIEKHPELIEKIEKDGLATGSKSVEAFINKDLQLLKTAVNKIKENSPKLTSNTNNTKVNLEAKQTIGTPENVSQQVNNGSNRITNSNSNNETNASRVLKMRNSQSRNNTPAKY